MSENKTGAERIQAERDRQINSEQFDADMAGNDDSYVYGQLSMAGFSYEMATTEKASMPRLWPWSERWWKPTDRARNLEKAGALYLAEIERLKRRVELVAHKLDNLKE